MCRIWGMRQVSRKKMSVEGGTSVKKIVLLATAALVAMLILVPTAIAQESTLPASGGQTSDPLPASGGLTAPSALLPAAALIMGSGIVAYAIVRRR